MTIDQQQCPRRSCLYMPGANARALEKARGLDADVVIMDLEDAVAPDAKDDAREQIASALRTGGYDQSETWVRINALDSVWGERDLEMVIDVKPDGVLLPKVSSALDITRVAEQLGSAGCEHPLAIWAMIETPIALVNLASIAATAQSTSLRGFVLGANDLAKDLRLPLSNNRTTLLPLFSNVLVTARAYGLDVIDSVWNDIADGEGFALECQQGLQYGFDGKSLIHPSQLEAANIIFAPEKEAVERAYRIRAAFADPANAGKGVIKVDGQMTELLHLEQAERLIACAEILAARRGSRPASQ